MFSGSERRESEDLIAKFCRFLKEEGRSQVTIMNYRSDLEGLVRWSESQNRESFNLRHFVETDLQQYRKSLMGEFKAATVNRKLATLKIFLRWAGGVGLLNSRPLPRLRNVKLVPKEKPALPWLKPADQARLMHCAVVGGEARDVAILTLMLNTGIRVSELRELRWKDVKIGDGNGTMTIHTSKQHKNIVLPLNHAVRSALIALGKRQVDYTNFVFTGRSAQMTRREVVMLLDRYFRMAGIGNLTPATLRHTFCMNLVTAGVSSHIIAKLMGVRNPEATLGFYEHLPQDLARAEELRAVELLPGS